MTPQTSSGASSGAARMPSTPAPSASEYTVAACVQPVYQGFAPIATCHYQNMSNILVAQGLPDAIRRICLSWGFDWNRENGILHGGNRWIELANQTYELCLQRMTFPTWEDAVACESHLLQQGLPFVAEVDAYELPSSYYQQEHVIHTVIVLSRAGDEILLLDSMNNPVPLTYSMSQYQRMRVSPCDGRVDDHLIYATTSPHVQEATPLKIIQVFYLALQKYWAQDMSLLNDFIRWVETATMPINVCRVAAERTFLSSLFEFLSQEDQRDLSVLSQAFSALAERWYLLHMITVNEQSSRRSQRPRMLRLLRELQDWESSLHNQVCTALQHTSLVEQHGEEVQ